MTLCQVLLFRDFLVFFLRIIDAVAVSMTNNTSAVNYICGNVDGAAVLACA